MRASKKQTIISYFIILVLIGIATAIGIKQQSYYKAEDNVDTILKTNLFGGKYTTGNIENYLAGNLYEKINGKADLYLNNGFLSMQTRKYSKTSDEGKWAEVFLYEMGTSENAFAVYSMQQRAESEPLWWAQFGYATSDGLYLMAGKYYIEVLFSGEDKTLLDNASEVMKYLTETISSGKVEIPYVNLFPKENLQARTFRYISADAFGSELKNIFAAEYTINDNTITAFMCKDSGGENFNSYYKFLIDNGGTELKDDIGIAGSKAVDLFGTTDVIFKSGEYFAGVRGSAPINDIKQAANKFFEGLSKK
ncbi:MAG: hypothetical protein A2Y12_12970 [Planctomycetes bacterium GWF2_42_9]|nr:MAG: hypothetical protein A2Y12_12970 [Planctomycetes bacterium GWF2_42_9]